jgi:hypothetical protein
MLYGLSPPLEQHHKIEKKNTIPTPYFLLSKENFLCFKLFHKLTTCLSLPMCFFSIFSCCIKSGDQPQEDLAKSDYKTNKEVENLEILLHVGEQLEPINGDFS